MRLASYQSRAKQSVEEVLRRRERGGICQIKEPNRRHIRSYTLRFGDAELADFDRSQPE